jgi:hypothetical protein
LEEPFILIDDKKPPFTTDAQFSDLYKNYRDEKRRGNIKEKPKNDLIKYMTKKKYAPFDT